MSRGQSGRTVPCDSVFATARYRKAERFALTAEPDPLSQDGEQRSVAVSNAALAGIAAADAICCVTLGRRSASSEHRDTVVLLNEIPGMGQLAGYHLRILLSVKHKAQYDDRNPTISEAKRAMRSMRSLMKIADSFL